MQMEKIEIKLSKDLKGHSFVQTSSATPNEVFVILYQINYCLKPDLNLDTTEIHIYKSIFVEVNF